MSFSNTKGDIVLSVNDHQDRVKHLSSIMSMAESYEGFCVVSATFASWEDFGTLSKLCASLNILLILRP